MSQEIPDSRSCAPRTRRVYSAQFKAELIAACQQPGASIAATAREHGMNANVLHRWLKEHRQVPAPDRMRYGACCCVWHRPAVRRCSW
jgi:transposase-like protein